MDNSLKLVIEKTLINNNFTKEAVQEIICELENEGFTLQSHLRNLARAEGIKIPKNAKILLEDIQNDNFLLPLSPTKKAKQEEFMNLEDFFEQLLELSKFNSDLEKRDDFIKHPNVM